ncbi:unnamed protein product [Allacma fusca]|nr:unnamed protein product [Allacma fusca]
MSRLDLLRNPPPNVPITLPSLRPLPKLQRGTFNSLLGSSSHRNFLNAGLGHNYGLTTPNFSISQQLLKSAKATCRAKYQARAMISHSGILASRTTKMSSLGGKIGSTPVPGLVTVTGSAVMEDLNCGGANAADAGGPFVCDLCGKRYVHHRSLNDHKKFHTGATTCQYCNKAFSKVANLRAHILAQHKDGGTDGFPML